MIPFDARNVWVLFANRSQAKIFSGGRAPESIQLTQSLENPTGTLKDRDFDADKAGRGLSEEGGGGATLDREDSATQKDAERFAKEVAQTLSRARSKGEFDSLVVVAEPRFLGLLRAQFENPMSKMISDEIPKDFIPLEENAQLKQARELVRNLA